MTCKNNTYLEEYADKEAELYYQREKEYQEMQNQRRQKRNDQGDNNYQKGRDGDQNRGKNYDKRRNNQRGNRDQPRGQYQQMNEVDTLEQAENMGFGFRQGKPTFMNSNKQKST